MWTTMKHNLLGKKNWSCSFYLYRFRKYVSYGFTVINFCNPGVHYETPCIFHNTPYANSWYDIKFPTKWCLLPNVSLCRPPQLYPHAILLRSKTYKETESYHCTWTSTIVVHLQWEETSTYLMKHRHLVVIKFSWSVRLSLLTSIVFEVTAPHSSDCDEASGMWYHVVLYTENVKWRTAYCSELFIGEICQILQAMPPHRTRCFKVYVIRQSPISLASATL